MIVFLRWVMRGFWEADGSRDGGCVDGDGFDSDLGYCPVVALLGFVPFLFEFRIVKCQNGNETISVFVCGCSRSPRKMIGVMISRSL